ncbi:type I methionyl aminopeptidase [bacterium]|nr:type I methionyl aminopeptidase [bacterium]MBU1675283.1 type I methionyl aminopeptidase [bacterium]
MEDSAHVLAQVFLALREMIAVGVTTGEVDALAERMIADAGCVPSFKGYNGFPATCCISVNEEVVHGIPGGRVLLPGDIVGVDCGLIRNGWHSDSAETFAIGEVGEEAATLLRVTRECLELAIGQVGPGQRISDVGKVVETHARAYGFAVVESLVGHGIGRALHEDPQVPNYRSFSLPDPVMEEGLVIAIEPMINAGAKEVVTLADQWTIVTADRRLSAHFEHTVAVTADGAKVLTAR